MSGIVLSASVRQNLLSLQSTAALLATTQNDLATGNRVNSALDNPTEYFTAQGLNNRASDISNLLDGINNGVQVLQAANTGITSLQSLIASAQSIANQVLQAPTGYSTKSSVTAAAITGANANNLLGTTGANATAVEQALLTGGVTPTTVTATTSLGGTAGSVTGSSVDEDAEITGTALAAGATAATALSGLSTPPTNGQSLVVNGKTITFVTALPANAGDGNTTDGNVEVASNGNTFIKIGTGTVQDVIDALNIATGAQAATISGGNATLSSVAGKPTASIDTSGDLVIGGIGSAGLTIGAGGTALAALGLSAATGTTTPSTAITGTTLLNGATGALSNSAFAAGDTLTVNGKTVSFVATAPTTGYTQVNGGTDTTGNVYVGADGSVQVVVGATTTVNDALTAIDLASGVQTYSVSGGVATSALASGQTTASSVAGGKVTLESSTGEDLNITASNNADLTALGLTPSATTGAVTATRTASASGLGTLISAGSTLDIDGKTITFVNSLPATTPFGSGVDGAVQTDGNGNSLVSLSSGSIQDVLNAIDLATGVQTARISSGVATLSTTSGDTPSSIDANGKLNLSTGTAQNLTIGAGLGTNPGNALAALGLTAGTTADSSLQGETLNITATGGGGTVATAITFGTGPGQVSTLNELNAALAANNLQASIDTTGAITISTANNAASETVGALTGTATGSGQPFASVSGGGLPPVVDPNSQATRASLVSQYNNVLTQITTTAQDSSFNGINLLNGDTLNLTFDETGDSKLAVQGFTFSAGNLGLSALKAGTDFLDNNSANAVLAQLTVADTTLRTAASSLGSNLSVVEIRQDFNKNLVNVLQTGASNLTIADPNEEAANSQALSTRQSIAVSALALANQSQQSVLQLLR
jgi:flagellin